MEQTEHLLNVIEPGVTPKRIAPQDISEKRLTSLRQAVVNFCDRAKSPVEPMTTWNFFTKILRGQEVADLWWSIDSKDEVDGFSVVRTYQDFDNQWTAYIMFGWGTCNTKQKMNFIVDDYASKGIRRFQFITRRDEAAFQRWVGDEWKAVATTFELRR